MPLHIAAGTLPPPPPPYVQIQLPQFQVTFWTGSTFVTIPAVTQASTQIGRTSSRFDGSATGQASLTAHDVDRVLDADNTASPLYGKLTPSGPTTGVVSVYVPTVGFVSLYTGGIGNIDTTSPDGDQRIEAQVSLIDAKADLMAHKIAAGTVYPQQQTGARILALLGARARGGWGWLNRSQPAGIYAIDVGMKMQGALTTDGSTSTIDYITAAAAAEEGLFFFDQNGTPTFHDQLHRPRQTTPAWVFGDAASGEIPYDLGATTYRLPNDRLVEDVAYTTTDGVTNVFGPGGATTMTEGGTAIPLASRYAGASKARSIWTRYSVNRRGLPQIQINPLADYPSASPTSRFWCAVNAEVGDLVTVNRRPGTGPATSHNYFIDAKGHTRTADSWVTTFTLVLADVPNGAWRLGVDYIGPLSPTHPKLIW